MVKHMVRLFIEPPKGEADTAINNWVANHNEWDGDPADHSIREVAIEGETNHVRADYRFYQEETPTALLDDLTNRLASIQGGVWYRIGYHQCDHDEQSGGACSWDTVRESTETVPADIPDFK